MVDSNHSPKNPKKKRIREIEEEKRKIADELRQLDQEIDEIKGGEANANYKKREKVHKDPSAQKQAESLVKELKNQRKELELRKKQEMEKALLEMQK